MIECPKCKLQLNPPTKIYPPLHCACGNVLEIPDGYEQVPQPKRMVLSPVVRADITNGPGTELKKLVSWFVWNKNIRNCGTCATREQRMNRWGPDKCQQNILTIIEWLRESAVKHGYPFSERIAAALIRKAIDNSRK